MSDQGKPPIQAPADPVNPRQKPDFADTMVPAKNPEALLSYYLGLFSIFPVLGVGLGAFAVWLGRKGLRAAKDRPEVRGATHAYVGIGCGAIGFLLNFAWILLFVIALVSVLRHPVSGG